MLTGKDTKPLEPLNGWIQFNSPCCAHRQNHLFYLILSYLILSYLFLSYLILSYLIFIVIFILFYRIGLSWNVIDMYGHEWSGGTCSIWLQVPEFLGNSRSRSATLAMLTLALRCGRAMRIYLQEHNLRVSNRGVVPPVFFQLGTAISLVQAR